MKKIVLIVMLLLFSCSEATTEKTELTKTEKALSYLEKQGFDLKDHTIEDDYIVVGKDMAFEIDDLVLRFNKKDDTRKKQFRTEFQVDMNKVNNIKVWLSNSLSPAWKSSAQYAMLTWNSVRKSRVYFTIVQSHRDADIIVMYNRNYPNTRGTFPSASGNVGNRIFINTNAVPFGANGTAMLHQFGHTIGLNHDGTTKGADPNMQILWTPYYDKFSIMTLNFTRYVTAMDEQAISLLYPL